MNSIDKEHLINCNENILDKAIYRVFKIEHLLEWFIIGKIAFCKPDKWEDPWEEYLFKKSFRLNKDENGVLPYQNIFYAQCWTLNEHDTDLIWKLYSPDRNGVRIKTSIKKIYKQITSSEEFIEHHHNFHAPELFVGKVIYNKDTEIVKVSKKIKRNFDEIEKDKAKKDIRIDKSIVRIPFKKRIGFHHEREFRLVYCTNDFDYKKLISNTPKLFYFSIDPHEVIEEILFDPRMDKNLYNCYKDFLSFNIKYNKFIKQSDLYRLD